MRCAGITFGSMLGSELAKKHSSYLCRTALPACAPFRNVPSYRHSNRLRHLGTQYKNLKVVATPEAAQQTPDELTFVSTDPAVLQSWRSKMQLYNTMTRKKELFIPRPDTDKVQMYVCGVTVYDYSHIGHARVYVAFDILFRLLRTLGYNVQYVRNFTDVDDKIIARAAANGEDPLALAGRFIEEFHKDMASLGCLSPTLEPRATDFIPEMINSIESIIKNGHAYAVGGDVFFDVASLPNYGRLSGRAQEDNRAGERVVVDDRKRSPADFALWKSAKAGEPSWPSPWGPGRPGWHIECSAMIASLMGHVIDIHGGGRDLVFPHHENELAQSTACRTPCCSAHHGHDGDGAHESADFVRYWLHNGFVNVDSEKMSKSLGNFFTIRDVLQQYHPLALRWFLVGTQYRQPVNYTQRALEEASDRLYYVYQTLADIQGALREAGDPGEAAQQQAREDFALCKGAGAELLVSAMDGLLDDLGTSSVVSGVAAPLKTVNDLLNTKAGRKQKNRLQVLAELSQGLLSVLSLLGMAAADTQQLLAELKVLALRRYGVSEQQLQELIEQRLLARQAKDFASSDRIRLDLASKGILISDTPTGTTWRPGVPAE